jgi:hypothetical protein
VKIHPAVPQLLHVDRQVSERFYGLSNFGPRIIPYPHKEKFLSVFFNHQEMIAFLTAIFGFLKN